MIARHGKIVLDAYYAPYTADIPHVINSATKAVVGTLAAIAQRDGLLDSFDRPMLDFFRDRGAISARRQKASDHASEPVGHDFRTGMERAVGRPAGVALIEMGRSPDWVKFILDHPMSNAPGEIFNYNSGNPHLLSAIITKLTGMSARDYAKAKLFGPLGISVANWRNDPQGITSGGFGLSLLPRDMAKIGYLYLRNGEWEGKPLLPPAWIDRVSHATLNMNESFEPDLRYSNFFWALPDKHVYMAVGYHCEVIMVFPELDMVAVTTARDFCPFGKLADLISGAVKSEAALAPDPAGATLLANAIRNISDEKPPETGAMPEIASSVSGKTYKFPGNILNVKSLSLTFSDPQARYNLEMYPQDQTKPSLGFSGPIGLDGLYRKGEPTAFGIAAVKGKWLDESYVFDRTPDIGDGRTAKMDAFV